MTTKDIVKNAFILVCEEREAHYRAIGIEELSEKWNKRASLIRNGNKLFLTDTWATDCFAKVYLGMKLPGKEYDRILCCFFE